MDEEQEGAASLKMSLGCDMVPMPMAQTDQPESWLTKSEFEAV